MHIYPLMYRSNVFKKKIEHNMLQQTDPDMVPLNACLKKQNNNNVMQQD